MSLKVENLEKSMAKMTITVNAEELEKAIQKAYLKNRNKLAIQGFRKGKAPRSVIENIYGAGVFYEDAANVLIPSAYENAAKESKLEIVSRPDIEVEQIEKGKDFIFTATVAVKPSITLGEYKGIEIDKKEIIVTDEEITEYINKELEKNSRLITVDNRTIEDGDIVILDFEGFLDGEPFEGGKAEDYSLTIGSKSFIDTFEEQLIGRSLDEEAEINVTFPENYQAEELAGKPVLFKIKIKEIKVKEIPELDDEFAQDISEFDTLEEYKTNIKETLLEDKEKQSKTEIENELIDKIIENSQMELPEPMIASRTEQLANDFAQRISYQGLSMEQYFQYTGMNKMSFVESLKPQAIKSIETRLVLEEIVKQEEITVTEEEYEDEIEKMAAAYKLELDKIKETIAEAEMDQIKLDIAVQKAIDLVVSESKLI